MVDDPIGTAVNKVLCASLQNGNQNYDGNTIATHNLSEAKNVGIYELSFDMYIDAAAPAADKNLIQFVMNNDLGYVMLFTVRYKSDGTIRITQDSKSAEEGQSATLYTESLSSGKLPTNALANGKWHNLRFIVECNGLDSYVHLYIDGVKKGGGATYFYDDAVTHTTPIKSVTWRVHEDLYSEASDVNLYFDDMYLVYAGELK